MSGRRGLGWAPGARCWHYFYRLGHSQSAWALCRPGNPDRFDMRHIPLSSGFRDEPPEGEACQVCSAALPHFGKEPAR